MKYTPPADNVKEEPMAKAFSLDRVGGVLDNAALQLTDKRGCFSCHTNYSSLYVRPMIDANVQAHAEIRKSLEEMVTDRWVMGKPRWDAEVVATASALAYNDAL